MRYSLLLLLLLPGCAFTYQPKSAEDVVKIVKEAGGSGCIYIRGNSRPYADVAFLAVGTYGGSGNYVDCLGSIPQEARSVLEPK